MGFMCTTILTDGIIDIRIFYCHTNLYEQLVKQFYFHENLLETFKVLDTSDLTFAIEVEPIFDETEYYGFELNEDSNRRFVLGNFVVTHNTVMALKLISDVGKKVAIICGKEFIMNQWRKEARVFLPSARIGKIQGKIIDIEDKDIVLIMLQSLCRKDYPKEVFSSFGFTIIDECHHMSSEHFSKSLFKIVTKHTLGISATMERKDAMSYAFQMFIGDLIYSGTTNEDKSAMTVRGVKYFSHDEEFEEVIVDYNGDVKYSSMVTKLSEYNRRSEFILRVIQDILRESQGVYPCQMMILSQNISLLEYFYTAITHREIADVGYYIGGMSEKKLEESALKPIVLASYSMASEALNIKTLTTILYASPRTEIKQSSGRIRFVNEHSAIYDIIDSHPVFQRQWNKRKKYYQSENFNILMCTSDTYGEWNPVKQRGKKANARANTEKIANARANTEKIANTRATYDDFSDDDAEDEENDDEKEKDSPCLITL
jgi:superfamily II DNA or RNA helicase